MPIRYHRKTCAWGLLALITAISVSVLLLFCTHNVAMANDTVQLQDVMTGKVNGLSVTVNGTGHYFGTCINTNFINNTSQTFKVMVPIGLALVPSNTADQTMYTGGNETLTIPPGSNVFQIIAFCGQRWNHIPTTDDTFRLGPSATGSLLQTLKNINQRKVFTIDAEFAVWNQTDAIDISDNPTAQSFVNGGGGENSGGENGGGNGPSEGRTAGAIGAAATLIAAWLGLNAAGSSIGGAVAVADRQGTSEAANESQNVPELLNKLQQAGVDIDEFAWSLREKVLANYAAGSLPETLDSAEVPPSFHETYERLREAAQRIGSDSPDEWINLHALIDKLTTVRSIIVGAIAGLAADVLAALSLPWALAIGVAAGIWDKYGPDTMSVLEPFLEPKEADSGPPAHDGPVFTSPQPERYPNLNPEDLWKLPREQRLQMLENSKSSLQKMGDSISPPKNVEDWERKYDATKHVVDDYEQRAKTDPNVLDSDQYKIFRYQLQLIDTLRAHGPRMELQ